MLIPEGEVHLIDAIIGIAGGFQCPPEYITSGRLTEKTDVFSFRMLVFELLVGRCKHHTGYHRELLDIIRNHGENIDISMIVDPAISREIEEYGKQKQLQDVY